MKNILRSSIFYIILLILFIYKGVFINVFSNLNTIFKENNNHLETEINILKSENKALENELKSLTSLKYTNYNYDITRLSYRKTYNEYDFFIFGGEDKYKKNFALVNNNGLVGIISDVKKDYSECTMLPGVTNLSVNINNAYGTLSSYENNLFIIDDISNYDDIKINDEVYTSTLGTIKEKIFIGTVYEIKNNDIEKKVYVKSNVDFNNIDYLYVVGE